MYFGGGYLIFSPIAAEVLKRRSYKFTIIMGLCLYSLGAIMFWPTAHFADPNNNKAAFGGFLVCTLVIACGLATLETSANSYAVVIGNPATASARLQFCQSWNGVASFIGPLIASKAFFSEEGSQDLTSVQFVYLAVACAGAAVAVLFFFTKLPEVSQDVRFPARWLDLKLPPTASFQLPLDRLKGGLLCYITRMLTKNPNRPSRERALAIILPLDTTTLLVPGRCTSSTT